MAEDIVEEPYKKRSLAALDELKGKAMGDTKPSDEELKKFAADNGQEWLTDAERARLSPQTSGPKLQMPSMGNPSVPHPAEYQLNKNLDPMHDFYNHPYQGQQAAVMARRDVPQSMDAARQQVASNHDLGLNPITEMKPEARAEIATRRAQQGIPSAVMRPEDMQQMNTMRMFRGLAGTAALGSAAIANIHKPGSVDTGAMIQQSKMLNEQDMAQQKNAMQARKEAIENQQFQQRALALKQLQDASDPASIYSGKHREGVSDYLDNMGSMFADTDPRIGTSMQQMAQKIRSDKTLSANDVTEMLKPYEQLGQMASQAGAKNAQRALDQQKADAQIKREGDLTNIERSKLGLEQQRLEMEKDNKQNKIDLKTSPPQTKLAENIGDALLQINNLQNAKKVLDANPDLSFGMLGSVTQGAAERTGFGKSDKERSDYIDIAGPATAGQAELRRALMGTVRDNNFIVTQLSPLQAHFDWKNAETHDVVSKKLEKQLDFAKAYIGNKISQMRRKPDGSSASDEAIIQAFSSKVDPEVIKEVMAYKAKDKYQLDPETDTSAAASQPTKSAPIDQLRDALKQARKIIDDPNARPSTKAKAQKLVDKYGQKQAQ